MSVVVVTAFAVPSASPGSTTNRALSSRRCTRGLDRLVMIEKYESEQARSEHLKGAALAGLRSALDGKLRSNLDV
jgi:quinol monooxygenase YgiN